MDKQRKPYLNLCQFFLEKLYSFVVLEKTEDFSTDFIIVNLPGASLLLLFKELQQ